jgi:hypothetical protein
MAPVLLYRLRQAHRVGGDGGRDCYFSDENGTDFYELKSFTGRMGKRSAARSSGPCAGWPPRTSCASATCAVTSPRLAAATRPHRCPGAGRPGRLPAARDPARLPRTRPGRTAQASTGRRYTKEDIQRKKIRREPTALTGLRTFFDAMIAAHPQITIAAIWEHLPGEHDATIAYPTLRTYVISHLDCGA